LDSTGSPETDDEIGTVLRGGFVLLQGEKEVPTSQMISENEHMCWRRTRKSSNRSSCGDRKKSKQKRPGKICPQKCNSQWRGNYIGFMTNTEIRFFQKQCNQERETQARGRALGKASDRKCLEMEGRGA
jgi:hypothetical protein